MSFPSNDQELVPVEPQVQAVPWSIRETWLGLLLFVLVMVAIVVLAIFLPKEGPILSFAMAALEAFMVLPVVIILGFKKISWRALGFRKFSWEGMAMGCGAVVLIYPLIIFHNLILVKLGIQSQGDTVSELYQALKSPVPFLVAAVILAPLAEEIFFRGFLFQGLRQKYGWMKAMLISSAIFAGFHMQLVAIIPTFLLGCVLAFAYQRSNSIWPGMILHFSVNGLAMAITILLVQMGWV